MSYIFFLLQGWSSAYSIESVIMQINATLVKGKARVQFGANKVNAVRISITQIVVKLLHAFADLCRRCFMTELSLQIYLHFDLSRSHTSGAGVIMFLAVNYDFKER